MGGLGLLVWFLSIGFAGALAARNGQPSTLWVILAVFLGPGALVILLLAGNNEAGLEAQHLGATGVCGLAVAPEIAPKNAGCQRTSLDDPGQ